MSTRIEHQQFQHIVILFPYQQPVWLDVTLPLTFTTAMKHMGTILGREFPVTFQQFDDLTKIIHGVTTLDAAIQILLKLMSGINLVHQIPIFLKNSSLLSYEFTRPSLASSKDCS